MLEVKIKDTIRTAKVSEGTFGVNGVGAIATAARRLSEFFYLSLSSMTEDEKI